LIHLDYQHNVPTSATPATALILIATLFIAWGVYAAGVQRVNRLSWAGYDPDPDISQSLANDARRANVILPFLAVATVIDVVAVGLAITGFVKRQRWWWNLLSILLCLLSAGWHGLGLFSACIFAG
jgi:hypothetical protein